MQSIHNDLSADDVLPLTETTFLILLSLANEPSHGYAIMQDVEVLSDGRVRFSTGTLYGALNRLLRDSWIARVDESVHAELSNERNKKYYRLTETGEQALNFEIQRLHALLEKASLRKAEATS
jgi:DNA-binding PadR family transcriptional regulator